MQVNEFDLVNQEKVQRAIDGFTYEGKRMGGLPSGYKPEDLLAEYDRLGGYITKDGVKVKNGSFYDFVNKCPRKEPEIKFETEVEGEIMEVTEDEAKSIKKAKEKIKMFKAKKIKKLKKE
jgi:hypothetical protein